MMSESPCPANACETAPPPVRGIFAQFLEDRRQELNQQYARKRLLRPQTDEHNVIAVLTQVLAPLVDAVAQADLQLSGECGHTARMFELAEALYPIALDLAARDLLGPGARNRHAQLAWADVLRAVPLLVAAEPERMAAAVTNAVYHLSEVAGGSPSASAAPEEETGPSLWIRIMAAAGPDCADVREFLEAGKVAAWRCGCAQYRAGALAAARRLPEAIARKVLGLKSLQEWRNAPPLQGVLDRLESDPWLNPRLAGLSFAHSRLRIVRVAGGFRGLGGPFLTPPQLGRCEDGALAVLDAEGCWELHADIFGAVFLRRKHRTAAATAQPLSMDGWVVSANGDVTHNSQRIDRFAELAGAWSCADLGGALAVTTPLSHHVYILAHAADPGLAG
ncbi:hypothetical protein DB346_00020 [Verrucomicrobia bacterium LW23]|nr:hypothetical protein DB346_00020 [Verrucomicrobia bacterium LW23]